MCNRLSVRVQEPAGDAGPPERVRGRRLRGNERELRGDMGEVHAQARQTQHRKIAQMKRNIALALLLGMLLNNAPFSRTIWDVIAAILDRS